MSEDSSAVGESDDDWGEENEDRWYQLVKTIRAVLADPIFSIDSTMVDLGSSRFDPCVVDMTVLDTRCLSREKGLRLAHQLKASLSAVCLDWSIRVWIVNSSPTSGGELVEWLLIDRYRVAEYFGRVSTVRFHMLDEFITNCWPKGDQ